jgi:deoxyribodipyrimidine photolyase
MSTKLKALLQQLDELEIDLYGYQQDRQGTIQAIMAPVQKAIDEVNAAYTPKLAELETACAAIRAEVEAEVLAQQATYKGTHWQVVYNKPAITWDGKKLEGMMLMIPQLEGARKVGQPKVSWRQVKS